MAQAVRVGGEFLVNTATSGNQMNATITGLADGGFVIGWLDNVRKQGDGVAYAQMFDAQGAKVGDAFVVSGGVRGNQAITALDNGGFVATWESTFTGLGDEGGASGDVNLRSSINAQVFDASGAKVGDAFLVNTTVEGGQKDPSVAALANGGFVVSWSDFSDPVNFVGGQVRAQAFDPSGVKIGEELVVDTEDGGGQYFPKITGLDNGGFVATWFEYRISNIISQNIQPNIRMQLFDEAGIKVGGEIVLSPGVSVWQTNPQITSLANGDFVIIWHDQHDYSDFPVPGDNDRWGVFAQIFNAGGERVGTTFVVNTQAAGDQTYPTVAALPDGGFVASWQDQDSPGVYVRSPSIKAQVFDASGAKQGDEFLVNTGRSGNIFETGDRLFPAIATLANGDFVVSWQDSSGTLGDTDGSWAIHAQIFSTSGAASAPVIGSDGGGASAALTVAENTILVTTVSATDADAGTALVYAISGGVDAALFDIDASTGALSFKAAPNFEAPGDVGADNVYEVVVSASDGALSDTQALTITVTDVEEYNLITGTAAKETLTGTAGDDRILGLDGNDTLKGLDGNDLLDGGLGNDAMSGGLGDDIYVVDAKSDKVTEQIGEGTDTVQTTLSKYTLGKNVENLTFTDDKAHTGAGNALANHLTGGAGNDVLNGFAGADVLEGGLGGDTYTIDNVGDVVIEAVGGGTDRLFASVSYALSANSEVETLTLTGSKLALALTGSDTDNVLIGNGNANVLSGLGGNDTLYGGRGNDTLTGGAGADRFVFDARPDAKANLDTVTDFTSGSDVLVLDRSVFKAFALVGAISAEAFWSGAGVSAAHDADDRLIYNTTTGALFYDADGIGRGAAVQIALLAGNPDLAFSDFQIVA